VVHPASAQGVGEGSATPPVSYQVTCERRKRGTSVWFALRALREWAMPPVDYECSGEAVVREPGAVCSGMVEGGLGMLK
jgi:hypothetical protein